MLKTNIVAVLICVFLLSLATGVGQTVKRSQCPSGLDLIFEIATNLGKPGFYIVDKDHLLEATFDKHCGLIEVRGANKRSWNRSDGESAFEDRNLTGSEFRDVLNKIRKKYPFGDLVESDKIAFSRPLGATFWDKYEKAYVNRTSYSVEDNDGRKNFIVSFTILFVHNVKGTLKEKKLHETKGVVSKARFLIDDHWYWSDEATYRTSTENKAGTFKVYGAPVSLDY